MSAPSGVLKNRWNQAVNAISSDMGWTSQQSDAFLNSVWAGLPQNEIGNDILAHDKLRKWLEANTTGEPTLPAALVHFLT